jgi:hypothetical protein
LCFVQFLKYTATVCLNFSNQLIFLMFTMCQKRSFYALFRLT